MQRFQTEGLQKVRLRVEKFPLGELTLGPGWGAERERERSSVTV